MRPKQVQGNKVVFADEKQEKEEQRQSKLAAINTKAKDGKLTLADINDKLDILLEEIRKK